MVILIKRTLAEFANKHPTSAEPLNHWYDIARKANWGRLADIKEAFNNVDYVGNDRYVFYIKGNDYRLVVMIFFDKRPYISGSLVHIVSMIKLIVQLYN